MIRVNRSLRLIVEGIKRKKGRLVNALALRDEEGRDSLRKATGSWQ